MKPVTGWAPKKAAHRLVVQPVRDMVRSGCNRVSFPYNKPAHNVAVREKLSVILAALVMAGCSRKEGKIIIKIVSVCPPSNPVVTTEHFIKKAVEEKSRGEIASKQAGIK